QLAEVANVERALALALRPVDALPGEARDDALLHLREETPQLLEVDLVLPADVGPREVVQRIDEEEADRARDAGKRRHDHLGHLQLERQVDGVERPRAAERDEAELAGIEAALDGDEP